MATTLERRRTFVATHLFAMATQGRLGLVAQPRHAQQASESGLGFDFPTSPLPFVCLLYLQKTTDCFRDFELMVQSLRLQT